ncbi:MAG: ABC-F family ATP-binding cassette domain-containing protein [Bacteroidales bacterium]|nr:ABC-F family ATP-binding cassette domain-containing protein [Bacteroidales bacterium]MBP5234478.1 ABC-F family ATP-binding cassette domain-containing protein [Bacteroidales bacterium]
MASYLQIENISKSYGPKILFEHIGFNINEGDKIALIAPNGTGKTSLLRILAGKDKSDSGGKITFLRHIRIAFLEQEYDFDPEAGIFDQIMNSSAEFRRSLDQDSQFQHELRVRQLLTSFGLSDFGMQMKNLSGGEVKRVALTEMLATEADFYIMDEPTNHLDIDAIEFLEGYLSRSRCTLLMVTHDRYFLERVCNTVMEMDHGAVYIYKGDYENYLEKRQERIDNYNAETDKVRNILRRELEWMRSTPCARTGKAKYRKDAFYELKDRAEQVYRTSSVDLSEMGGASRLGSKIINCKNLSFWYGGKCYLDNFTYNFQRYERVGIVGRNGAGKTTFINLLTGNMDPSDPGTLTGIIDRGESLKIGYYHQKGMTFDEDQTVLETVNDTHLLSRFLFPHDMLNNKISKLSGGEKRRLYLLTILKEQPNLLILDEPTNDLDIVTLNVLEEYLKEYKGSLIIVSHDRHFLDRLVDHLFVFCGDGVVKDFIGSYTEYRTFIKDYEAEQKASAKPAVQQAAVKPRDNAAKKKMSFKEKQEFAQLEKDIEALGAEKAALEEKMNSGTLPYDELQAASERFGELTDLLDEKELRWLELSELS